MRLEDHHDERDPEHEQDRGEERRLIA